MPRSAMPLKRPRDRKAQLAGIAAELFCAQGYLDVGINDIAEAAGITGPALYRHFVDKQTILADALRTGIGELETATAEGLRGSQAPSVQQIETLVNALSIQAVERRSTAALWRWESRHLAEDDQREIRHRSRAILGKWAKVLITQRPELAIEDAELLCWAGLSVFGSLSTHQLKLPRTKFVALLSAMARRVLHVTLPKSSGAAPALRLKTTSTSRREIILTAAIELFHRRGFSSISMEEIGVASGITGPSVYRHFASKAELLGAIYRRAADRLTLSAENALSDSWSQDANAVLTNLIESYVDVLIGSGELSVTFSHQTSLLPERERTDFLRAQRDYLSQWVKPLLVNQPDLSTVEARITILAAFTVVNDLVRTGQIAQRPHLPSELVTLMRATVGLK